MPKFSFIIPIYNVENYLCKCLDSIVQQQFKDYEAILIDDGSTDNSPAICDEYAERYPHLRVVHKENGGVSSARNVGLDVAKGEWIWFVDADDYIKEKSLELLADVVISNNCDLVFHGLIYVYEDGIVEEQHNSDLVSEKDGFLLKNYCYQNGMLLFKADIIKNNHLRFTFGMKMTEDLEFQYKYLLHCERPVSIPYSLYYIRERENSASRNVASNSNNLQGNKLILANILAYVQSLTDKGHDWLGTRMAERIKSLMQAAALTPSSDTKEITRLVRGYVKSYRSLGFAGFDDWSLRLAAIDVRIYYFLYKFRLLINRQRK